MLAKPHLCRTVLVMFAAACTTGGADADPDSADPVPADTGDDLQLKPLPEGCEPLDPLPADPLTLAGEARTTQDQVGYLIELVDAERFGDLVLGVGQGGLLVYDVSDPAAPFLLGKGRGPGQDRFHRVEVLDDRYVAVSNREFGVAVFDLADPSRPTQVWSEAHQGWEGLALVDGHLVVTTHDGVVVFDVSDPTSPESVGEATGLSAAWELSAPIGSWVYAADNELGVVPVDVSDPTAPVVGVPLALGGGVLHVEADGDTLYASLGGSGVAILDAAAPGAPVEIGRVSTGGAAVMSAVADDILFVVDHEALSAWNVADPADPRPLGRQQTEQFALAVAATGDIAWVGDWALLGGWRLDREASAGSLDLPGQDLTLGLTTVTNRGGGTLQLFGASGDNITVEAGSTLIPPGGATSLRVLGTGSTVCISTNDPDGPVFEFAVTDAGAPPVGTPAPDFSLLDLDGAEHRLSEQLGHPVLLVYFATW